MRAAEGRYLIFFDGDCLASSGTVEAHVRVAEQKRYLAGGKALLSRRFTDSLSITAIQSGQLDHFGLWWRQVGKVQRLLINRLPGIRTWFDRNVPRPPAWRGENSSTFTEHVYQVGGFDERFTAPVLHLEHPRPYVRSEECERNRAIFDANQAAKMTLTPYGIRDPAPAIHRTS